MLTDVTLACRPMRTCVAGRAGCRRDGRREPVPDELTRSPPGTRCEQRPPLQVQPVSRHDQWGGTSPRRTGCLASSVRHSSTPSTTTRLPELSCSVLGSRPACRSAALVLHGAARQTWIAPRRRAGRPPGSERRSADASKGWCRSRRSADRRRSSRSPSLLATTHADAPGCPWLSAIPAGAAALQLRVRAKAQEFPFTVDTSAPQPVTLRLDLAKG